MKKFLLIGAAALFAVSAQAGSPGCKGDCEPGPYDKGPGNHGHPHDHGQDINSHPNVLIVHEHPTDPIVVAKPSGWYAGGALGASSSDRPTRSEPADDSEIFSATASTYGGDDGKDGKDGEDGRDGSDGEDGRDGADGEDGEDGSDGKDGADGRDGQNGTDGRDGRDGLDAPALDNDTNELAFRIFAGKSDLLNWKKLSVGLELGYANLGDFQGNTEVDAVDLTAAFWIPLGSTWNVLVRGGAAYWDGNGDDIDGTMAVGVTKDLGSLRLRLEGQRYADANAGEDVDVLWLGAAHRF